MYDEQGSYADPQAILAHPTTVQYSHSLSEVVNAAIGAGLTVLRLDEHLSSPMDLRGVGNPDQDGQYRIRVSGYRLPVMYTVIAASS